jgi:hypothetical protein
MANVTKSVKGNLYYCSVIPTKEADLQGCQKNGFAVSFFSYLSNNVGRKIPPYKGKEKASS